jgi:hypothetical protein
MYWTWTSQVPSRVANAGDVGVALGSGLDVADDVGDSRRRCRPPGVGVSAGVAAAAADGALLGIGAVDGNGVAGVPAGSGVVEGGFGVPLGTGGGGGPETWARAGEWPGEYATASASMLPIEIETNRRERRTCFKGPHC